VPDLENSSSGEPNLQIAGFLESVDRRWAGTHSRESHIDSITDDRVYDESCQTFPYKLAV
jgi:hypothetical protein